MLFSYVATALTQFATHEATVREYMKAVRTREESLDDMRRRRKALGAKAEAADKKLLKMNTEVSVFSVCVGMVLCSHSNSVIVSIQFTHFVTMSRIRIIFLRLNC